MDWNDFMWYCPEHFVESECDCVKKKLWSFKKDCHGRRGDDVVKRANVALDILAKFGIHPATPDIRNSNWSYGKITMADGHTEYFPRKERLGVFAYHIKRFVDAGKILPDYFFMGDQCDSNSGQLKVPDDNDPSGYRKIEWLDGDDECDREPEGPVTYYIHPTKGKFKVCNFKTAIEIFGITSAIGDTRADSWYTLAFSMPDAPQR